MDAVRPIVLQNAWGRLSINPMGARITEWGNTVLGTKGVYFDPARPNRSTHPCGPNFGEPGTTYPLKRHGFLRDQLWRLSGVRATPTNPAISLELSNTTEHTNAELFQQYPFYFIFKLSLEMRMNKLHYRLAFNNLSDTPAPVDLAAHTYHPWEAGMRIPELQYHQYQDLILPEQNLMMRMADPVLHHPGNRDWAFKLRPDDRSLHLRYPSGKIVTLEFVDGIDTVRPRQLVLWTAPKEGNFICVEPVLVGDGAFASGHALQVLPNQTVALEFILSMTG